MCIHVGTCVGRQAGRQAGWLASSGRRDPSKKGEDCEEGGRKKGEGNKKGKKCSVDRSKKEHRKEKKETGWGDYQLIA